MKLSPDEKNKACRNEVNKLKLVRQNRKQTERGMRKGVTIASPTLVANNPTASG